MVRNVSVCIFASVAVLLFSSDASACWRSRTCGCGCGYGYYGTSYGCCGGSYGTSYGCCGGSGYGNGSGMATGLRPGRLQHPGGIGEPASGVSGVGPGREATTRAALAGQRRGWVCGPAWALAAPAGDADRFWLDDGQGGLPVGPVRGEQNPEDAVTGRSFERLTDLLQTATCCRSARFSAAKE